MAAVFWLPSSTLSASVPVPVVVAVPSRTRFSNSLVSVTLKGDFTVSIPPWPMISGLAMRTTSVMPLASPASAALVVKTM